MATQNDSAELSGEQPQPFELISALDVYCTFFEYITCSDESDKTEDRIAQQAFLLVYIATMETCLEELESQIGNRQKMHTNNYASYVTAAIW